MAKEALNEEMIYESKPHWIRLIVPMVISVLLALVAIYGFISGVSRLSFGDISSSLFVLLIAAIVFLIPFLIEKTNKLVLTDKRLYGKTGIIKIQKLSVPISKIQYINIDRGVLGRVIGYSDIKINAVTGTYIFKKQKNAEEMQNAILNTIK